MRIGELQPGDRLIHPTTRQHVTLKEVKRVRKMLRLYFTAYGVTGWFMIGSMDQEIEVPRK